MLWGNNTTLGFPLPTKGFFCEMDDKYVKAKQESKNLECMQYLDTFLFCLIPPNQIRTYYRIGQPDSCAIQFKEMMLCFRLKLKMSDEERYDQLMKLQRKGKYSPTDSIWQFREDPAADWTAGSKSSSTSE